MSKYGMLGLLEGVGQGMQGTGKAMTVNALAAAEDQRKANREKVRREWTEGQDQKKYDRNRADQLTDQGTAIIQEQTTHNRNRAEQVADQAKALTNRAPSAFKEKVDYFTAQRDSGEITLGEYKAALGIAKANVDLTADEIAKHTFAARKQAEKELASDTKSMNMPIDQRTAWIDRRSAELLKPLLGNSGGGQGSPQQEPALDQKTISDLANYLNNISPATQNYEIKKATEKVGAKNVKAALDLLQQQQDGESLKRAAATEEGGKGSNRQQGQKDKRKDFKDWINSGDSKGLLENSIRG